MKTEIRDNPSIVEGWFTCPVCQRTRIGYIDQHYICCGGPACNGDTEMKLIKEEKVK